MLVVAVSFAASNVFACSFEKMEEFIYDSKKVQEVKLATPIVKVEGILRGNWSLFNSCSDAGIVTISVTVPKDLKVSIKDYGVHFRVISGIDGDEIIPDQVMDTNDFVDNYKTFSFPWLDGDDIFQEPIHLKVEVTLVSKEGFVSEPVIVEINDD